MESFTNQSISYSNTINPLSQSNVQSEIIPNKYMFKSEQISQPNTNRRGNSSKFKINRTSLQLRKSIMKIESPKIFLSSLSNPTTPDRKFLRTYETPLISSFRREEQEDNDRNISQKLNESSEIVPEDKEPKDVLGESAIFDYYSHYKKLDLIQQQNKHFNVADSPFTSMLQVTEKNLITPCKLGLIKSVGNEDQLRLTNMNFGDKYAEVLNEGLRKNQQINKYFLRGNRITNQGADSLLKTISKNAKILDLQDNQIGRIGVEHICHSIQQKDCKIEYLNLEGNKLGDSTCKLLFEAVKNNKTMKKLNLSKNFLTNQVADQLKQFLEDSSQLIELYLHWNNLTAPCGQVIFSTLKENEQLKVLDLSSNALGSGGTCSQQICEFLEKNIEVRHLDLSSNYFNVLQSHEISMALEKNKSIYGFHFAGNVGYVDSRGFLVFEEENNDSLHSGIHIKQRIESCNQIVRKRYRTFRDKDITDCCWICEGWEEQEFVWDKNTSGDAQTDPFFIHFNFENYVPCYYGKQGGNQLTYKRMVPPGDLYYFFTANDQQVVAQDHGKKQNPEEIILENILTAEGAQIDVEMPKLNYRSIQRRQNVLRTYLPTVSIEPRTRDPVYIPPKQKKTRIKWKFPISLMYKWRPDNDDLVTKCFEFDWEAGKIPRLVKKEEELEQVKQFYKENYKNIKDTYKYFASFNPVGDIWGIQNAAFWEFIHLINIIDGKLIADADINLKWTSTISGSEKGNPRNPVQAINRYQFMEVLTRIAEEKYIFKFKTTTNYFEAVKQFWEEHLKDIINKYDSQPWREEKYWNEDCDMCMKNYKRIIDYIYKKFSTKKVKPGQVPFMCLDELQQITQMCDLAMEPHFGTSVYLFSFNLSMMTQVDELNNDRIFQMSQVEFYEALARLADEASLVTPFWKDIYPENTVWTLEKRKEMKLGHKLEGLIMRIWSNICDGGFKQTHPKIEKSFFWKDPDESDYELVDN